MLENWESLQSLEYLKSKIHFEGIFFDTYIIPQTNISLLN